MRFEGNRPLKFDMRGVPYRVFATWNIHYGCNYRCTYCHALKPGMPGAAAAPDLSLDRWFEIWKKNYVRYGSFEMTVSGGEPFAYQGFMDLIIELSKMHLISVCTNLEWDVEYFVSRAHPKRMRIESSYHPEFAVLDTFVSRLKVLKRHGFNPTVNFVPWPPLLEKMRAVKDAVEGAGCQLTLQPFIGRYDGREYPQGYTDREREYFKIFKDNCNLSIIDFKTAKEPDSPKGTLCRMGQYYAFITPDGTAYRCCRDHSATLGNLIDGTFRLLEAPAPCQADNCNCWRRMVAGKEDSWARHWGRGEVTSKIMKDHGRTL